MEQAIKKAIEGGWKPFTDDKVKKRFELEEHYAIFYDSVNVRRYAFSDMFINPKFWQALGKNMNWRSCYKHRMTNENILRCSICGRKPHVDPLCSNIYDEWKDKWHSFIDHLASGKDAESFFKSLLTPNNK